MIVSAQIRRLQKEAEREVEDPGAAEYFFEKRLRMLRRKESQEILA
jgi:hypothetical protein